MIDRELLGPSLDRETERELVRSLRRIVGMEPTEVQVQAARSRVASDNILRRFHIPAAHRVMLWS